MIDLRRLCGLETRARGALELRGEDRNAAVSALLEGARTALAVVEAVDRVPALRSSEDTATDGLPPQLVLYERRHGPRGSRLVLRASWGGEGAERCAVVSIEFEMLERGVWRRVGWGGLHVVARELPVVARFFADAAKADQQRAREQRANREREACS